MKTLGNLITVLIIGTLSCVNAQRKLETKELFLYAILKLSDIPELANVTIGDIEKYERSLCDKNGPGAYEEQKEMQRQGMICIRTTVEDVKLKAGRSITSLADAQDIFLEEFCNKVPDLENCMERVTQSSNPCLQPEQRDNPRITYNVLSSLLKFSCDNKAEQIKKFMNNGGTSCFFTEKDFLMDCARKSLDNYFQSVTPLGSAYMGLQDILPLTIGAKECTYMEELQQCTTKVLESCQHLIAEIVNSVFELIIRELECGNYIEK